MADFSPMMKHYLQTKEQYKDCILLYRLGDFYEMFFEDAQKASKILDLTLTGKNCGMDERAPMCGVPYHAVDSYVAKLIAAGQKVAICEQLSDPKDKSRQIVERDVVRVITPGTVMESDILEDNRSNYIAAVTMAEKVGVAFCDVSTGEFCASELSGASQIKDLQELLVSYRPAEILCNSQAKQASESLECVKAGYVPRFSQYEESNFDKKRARDKVLSHYKISTVDGFGLSGKNFALSACGALLFYLDETQKRELSHLKNIRYVDKSRYMSIDVKTRRNLELTVSYRENKRTGSLLWLLDKTQTSMGARLLANWVDRPLQKASMINARLDGVEELYSKYLLRSSLVKALGSVYDVERLTSKIAYNTLAPKDCVTLKKSLQALPQIKTLLAQFESKILTELNNGIDCMQNVADELDRAIDEDVPAVVKDADFIKRGYNAQLDELYDFAQNGGQKYPSWRNTSATVPAYAP